MVTVRNLSASYGEEEVLHEVSASFPKGTVSVILGPNGSGKSTLLKALARLIPYHSGVVTVKGKDLPSFTPRELARQIAYLPQSRNIPEITAARMVMHGRFPYLGYPRRYSPKDRQLVAQALEELGILHLSDRKMEQLSGGQRQKVYLAMAIVQQTDIILMDEPTTYLDIRNQFEILDHARRLAEQGKTIIMILHDLNEAFQYADQIILLENGSVRIAGDAETVIRSKAVGEVFGIEPVICEQSVCGAACLRFIRHLPVHSKH